MSTKLDVKVTPLGPQRPMIVLRLPRRAARGYDTARLRLPPMTIRVDERTYDGPLLGHNGDSARKRFTLDVQQPQIIGYPSPRPQAGREQ